MPPTQIIYTHISPYPTIRTRKTYPYSTQSIKVLQRRLSMCEKALRQKSLAQEKLADELADERRHVQQLKREQAQWEEDRMDELRINKRMWADAQRSNLLELKQRLV